MKLALLFLLCVSAVLLGDTKPQQFALTVTITYSSVTLEEAAKIEKMLRKAVPDSCTVKINVGEVQKAGTVLLNVDSIGFTPKPWYWGTPNLKLDPNINVPEILH